MEGWTNSKKSEVESAVEAAKIEEFKKEYAEANTSKPPLEKLETYQMQIVKDRCEDKINSDMKEALQHAQKKAEFMMLLAYKKHEEKIDPMIGNTVIEDRGSQW